MKEIIDRILEGKFEYESGGLEFSESRIEINLQPGKDFEGSFRILGKQEHITEGFLYTSDSRMECLTQKFSGTGEEIGYIFHGKGMEEGDVLKGVFSVVSNQGEYTLPFVVMVSHPAMTASMGPVKNLFHFVNLAKSNWGEAVQLFYSPGFESLLQGSDRKYYSLYQGLSRYRGNERNVDEFLIATHKKQKICYIIDEDKIRLEASESGGRHEVLLTRNGWGYTSLQAEAIGNFITIDKKVLSDDDFLGNRCTYYFYIDRNKLHKGLNFGALRFTDYLTEQTLPIEVRKEDEAYEKGLLARKKKEMLVSMMEYYGAFRMKKISTKTWLQKNHELMDNWIELDDTDPEPKLYRVHLLITERRTNEATWMLDQARNAVLQSNNMDSSLWCYYLYLSTLQGRDEHYINTIAQEVADAYEKEPYNWRLGWLCLYLSPEYDLSYARKWIFIKEQYGKGCCSPVFYIEALLLMRLEPSLFMELGSFEMQVLRYAAKHDLLTDEIIMQLHYLVPRMREYSEGLLMILKKGYEKRKDSETLQNICTMLIRGNRRRKEDFLWYAAGVEENLRITNLYEYYMYSLDMEELVKLPKVIYMYFAYHNTLDWERSAFLYASLWQYREELPDLYEKERLHIQEFVIKMIQEGRINEHLALLYKKAITGGVMLDEAGEKLSPLLFSVRIQVKDGRMRKVVILYPKEIQEKIYPLSEGEVIVPIYGEEYTLLLEDQAGNRYVPEEGFGIERYETKGSEAKRFEAKESEAKESKAKEFGTEESEIKGSKAEESEAEEPEVKRFEIKRSGAKRTATKGYEIKGYETKRSEAKRSGAKEFKAERLFQEEKLLIEAEERDFETVSLQMYLCSGHAVEITEGNIARYQRILAGSEVSPDYKRDLIPGIVRFYYDSDRMEELDAFLDGLEPDVLDGTKRGEMIRYLVLRDKSEKALDWIRVYGINGIEPQILMRLSSRMIQNFNQTEDKLILFLCFYAFTHGKSDMATLGYLMEYYQGSTRDLRDIWKAAREKEMDVQEFGERILLQMLYSGCYVGERMDIFKACLKRNMDLPLEKAFLAQCCYDYFVREKVTEEVVFQDLERLLKLGEPVQKVCLLAYVRYYAEHKKDINESRRRLLESSLLKLLEEGVVLPCFLEYTDLFSFMHRFYDKTVIEYRTKPGRKVFIHYVTNREKDVEENYRKAEMKEVYGGVFIITFVLFFGEKLFYYIKEEYEEAGEKREELTGSGNVSRSDMGRDMPEGRFNKLNDIVIAEALQDYDMLGDMLEEYEKTDYMQNLLFELI